MPARQATVRQLLNHSSGLFDYTKVPGWVAQNREKSFTTSELVSIMRRHQAKAQPGSAWEYNNGGYVLLGAIIEQVTGTPWHEAIAQRIALSLGLSSIGYPSAPEAREGVVQGYGMGRDGLQPVALSNMSVPSAAGGLVGTPADLAKWARALHRGRVVPPVLYKEMTSPAKLTGGKAEPYGFGLRLRKVRGQTAFVHGGALAGFRAESVYLPESDTFVAVFANSEDPQTNSETVMIRLAALAIGKPLPEFTKQPIDRAAVTPLFGLYEREKGAPVRFHERGGKLLLGIGEREMELTPAGGNRFFREPDGLSWIGFTRAADGTPVMRLYDPFSAEPEQIRRSGGVPAPLSVPTHILASYHGTYQTETVELIVGPGENGWLTVTVQGETKPLRPVAATEFMVEGTPMKLVFHPEADKVDRLVLHRGARQLHGVRKAP
jgi:hypothetical protein